MVAHDVIDDVIAFHDAGPQIFVTLHNTQFFAAPKLLHTFFLTTQQIRADFLFYKNALELAFECVQPVDYFLVDVEFVWDEAALQSKSRVSIRMIFQTGWSGVIRPAVEFGFEPCHCWSKIEGGCGRTDAEVQAESKKRPKSRRRFNLLGEIMDCKVLWSLEVEPGLHVSKGNPCIFFDCFLFVGNEAELSFNHLEGIFYDEVGFFCRPFPFFCCCLGPPGCLPFFLFAEGEAGSLRPGEGSRLFLGDGFLELFFFSIFFPFSFALLSPFPGPFPFFFVDEARGEGEDAPLFEFFDGFERCTV
jgi:hypothetical protein